MSPFLTTHRLHLTPLAPIHIGCGEDFEPTNYVIDDGLLYGFDPSRAALNDLQRNKLMDAARRGSLPGIQRFFRDHADAFKPHAHVIMPVCSGVARMYEQRIGKAANVESSGNQVFNKLEIERHVYTGALQQPFIPGTSFKGALRTAWLDDLNKEELPTREDDVRKSTAKMERRLLGGDFQTSPLRLLKVADLMPTREPEREVLFAVNRKKKEILGRDGQAMQPKGIAARKDCVLPGQYRLFAADVTLPALLKHIGATDSKGKSATPQADKLNAQGAVDLRRLARQSNQYHLQRLRRELAVLDGRGLLDPAWKNGVSLLLSNQSSLGNKLEAGDAFLVRIGRYGSADSKTLTGEGVASIKIMGAKGQPPTFESTTKTVWLAAQNETDQKHLIPFGWAVVEIDPQGDCTELQAWCQQQNQGRPNMAEHRAQLMQQREKAEIEKARLQAEADAKAAKLAAERKQEAARAQAMAERRASLSPRQQQIESFANELRDQHERFPTLRGKPHGVWHNKAKELIKAALAADDWNADDKTALIEAVETWLPRLVVIEPKEVRKMLKPLKEQ